MRIVAIVQARLSSNRLPGKVLRSMAGQPMLGHLCESLARVSGIDGIVIATSTGLSDDPIVDFARRRSVDFYRGSLTDVAGRLAAAADYSNADCVVRVCGDSPLLDPKLVERAIAMSREFPFDLITNVYPRSFPFGQSVELMTTTALNRALRHMVTSDEREHVTKHMYAHPENFVIRAFEASTSRADVRLSVDTEQDFERCDTILRMLARPAWEAGWEACVGVYDRLLQESP